MFCSNRLFECNRSATLPGTRKPAASSPSTPTLPLTRARPLCHVIMPPHVILPCHHAPPCHHASQRHRALPAASARCVSLSPQRADGARRYVGAAGDDWTRPECGPDGKEAVLQPGELTCGNLGFDDAGKARAGTRASGPVRGYDFTGTRTGPQIRFRGHADRSADVRAPPCMRRAALPQSKLQARRTVAQRCAP